MINTAFAVLLFSVPAPLPELSWTVSDVIPAQSHDDCIKSSNGVVSICSIPAAWQETEDSDLSRSFRTKNDDNFLDIFVDDGFGHNGEIEVFEQDNTHGALEIAAANLLNKLAGGSVYSEETLIHRDVFILETLVHDPEIRYLSYSAEATTDTQTISIVIENTDDRYDEFALRVEEMRNSFAVHRTPLSSLLTTSIVEVEE